MKRFSTLILTVIFIMAVITPVCAAGPPKVSVDSTKVDFGMQPFMKDNTTMVPLRDISQAMGFKVTWTGKLKRIDIEGPNGKMVKLTAGNNYAAVDGRKVKMSVPAIIKNGKTFVPLRFVSQALGGTVDWYRTDNSVYINSGFLRDSLGKYSFAIDKSNGKIYSSIDGSHPKMIANLGQLNDQLFFTADSTPAGNVLLTIRDNYGEPHMHNDIHTLYINYANHTTKEVTAKYAFRFEDNIKFYNDQVVLTDGKIVYLIDDKSGKIKQKYDMVQLVGVDDKYFVEGMGDGFIMARPNSGGILTLVDLESHEKVQLYKELLDKDERDYVETNDIPYWGDFLKFTGQKGNRLYFRNNSQLNGEDIRSYIYEMKK